MSDYEVANEGDNWLVVRTSDFVVIARCTSETFANQVANALNP